MTRSFYTLGVRKPVTLNVDEQLLEAVRRAAADEGVAQEDLLEEALRRYFGLRGLAVLDEIAEHQRAEGISLSDDDAMALAVSEVRAARAERRHARGS